MSETIITVEGVPGFTVKVSELERARAKKLVAEGIEHMRTMCDVEVLQDLDFFAIVRMETDVGPMRVLVDPLGLTEGLRRQMAMH